MAVRCPHVSGADPRAGQEAARLLAAAQDWLRTSAPHLAPVDDEGRPCPCPLCRAVAGIRDASPDAVARWVDSAVTAVTSMAATAGAHDSSRGAGSTPTSENSEHRDRDDDGPGDVATDAEGSGVGDDDAAGRAVRRIRLDPGSRGSA